MVKAQSSILGVVILTGIVLGLISVTYLWGQPLIQKNVDRAQVNAVMEKLEELNDAILYTASTGSNSIINLDLTNSVFVVDDDNNRLVYETYSTIPMVASVEEVPINYYELAEERESITYNATWVLSNNPAITGYETVTHNTNTSIMDEFYNVSIYENTTSNEWDLICLWNNSLISSTDCAKEGEAIVKEGTVFDILSITSDGYLAYIVGGLVENPGVLGSEPSGIISAISTNLETREKITFYLTYRTMLSESNDEHKIIINCLSNCAASNSDKDLVISRSNVVINSNRVITYLNLEVQ